LQASKNQQTRRIRPSLLLTLVFSIFTIRLRQRLLCNLGHREVLKAAFLLRASNGFHSYAQEDAYGEGARDNPFSADLRMLVGGFRS
jgi:hypothetical protein